MNFFKRLTSVFLCCVLLSSSVLALDDVDSQDFYTLEAVQNSPISVYSATEWDTNDRAQLQGIYKFIQYFTTAPSSFSNGSLFGYLSRILSSQIPNVSTNFQLQGSYGTNGLLKLISDRSTSIYNYLGGDNIAGNLGKIQNSTSASSNHLLNIYKAVSDIDGYATETTLSSVNSFVYSVDNQLKWMLPYFYSINLEEAVDGKYTALYYLHLLQDVLANEEDKAIRDQQKQA